MTISTAASSTVARGNGVVTTFQFNFVADSASYIQVYYTDTTGATTLLDSSVYTLTINAAAVGSLWGVGGTVLYPKTGSPIANNTYLTIARVLPYTQVITISDQGDFAPQVIEEMGDTLLMQIQQISARTTQFRGIWKTATIYNVGDIAQDSTNGNNTKNYYICQIENTSGTWSTDLAAGDWAISVVATVPVGSNIITLTGDVTASSASPAATTLATVNANVGQFSGITLNAKGLATAATALTGDITSSGAATTLATVNSNVGQFSGLTINAKGLVTAATTLTGDITSSGAATTLATVNANVGSFTAATITVNAKGLVTAASNSGAGGTATATQANPGNPTGSSNATPTMQGLAGTITPISSGKVLVIISGSFTGAGGGASTAAIQIRYGTSTAPANAAALTGTAVGTSTSYNEPNGGSAIPFSTQCLITGLTPSTAYWVDLSLSSSGGILSSLKDISITAYEIK